MRDARAEELYRARCLYCHEQEGAIGTTLDARVLATYGSARRLFDYVKLAMPYDSARSMSDEEYWLSVEYLLRSRELVPPGTAVGEDNADSLVFADPFATPPSGR